MKKIISLFSLLLTSACSQLTFASVNLPAHFSDVEIIRDVSFGTGAMDKLDIYVPAQKGDAPLPVIVFYYGGRWEEGMRSQYRFAGNTLAKQGFITVIPDYRKYPEVKFPGFVEDGAKSLAWTIDNISRYGGDANRVYVSGHSAGAHIASLLVTDQRYLKAYGKDSAAVIKGFAGLSGPYAFIPEEADLKDMFGPPEKYPDMQATSYIDGNEAPMLLLWGEDDTAVGAFNHEKLRDAIVKKGGCVAVKTYPGVDHVWMAGSLSWLGAGKPDIASDIANFFRTPVCAPAARTQK